MTREEAITRIKDHIKIHRYYERNAVKIFEALNMAIKALEQPESCEDAVNKIKNASFTGSDGLDYVETLVALDALKLANSSSAQPEPAIPLSWINKEVEWLKSLDNSFAALTAGQISVMVKTWKDEQDGC